MSPPRANVTAAVITTVVWLALLSLLLVGCTPDKPQPVVTPTVAAVCDKGTMEEYLANLTANGVPYREETREDVKAALRELYNKTPPFAAMVDNENAADMFVFPVRDDLMAVVFQAESGCLTTGMFVQVSDYPEGSSI